MGSIQLFPRALPRQRIAHAWRAAPSPQGTVRVREARRDDFAAVHSLQRQGFARGAPLAQRQWERRLEAFRAGQLIATIDAQVVGAACALIVRWDEHGLQPTWNALTHAGDFSTHDDEGRTLFLAELLIEPRLHGVAIARALLQAQRRNARRLNLRRIVLTARLPGFRALREEMTPEDYAMRIVWGDVAETSWRFLLAQGFQYCGVLRGHRPEDIASDGHAGLLSWLNPLHAPPGPPADEESARARWCA